MMKKKMISIALLCALVLTVFTGCGSNPESSASAKNDKNSDEVTTIKFWHTWQGKEAEKFETIIEGFKEVHPEINVEVLGSTTEEKQMIAMSSGDSFDVGLTMDCIANKWANKGALADMTPYIEANGSDMDNYIPSLLNLCTLDGKQYGIPFTVDTFMMFYNKDMLAEAGYTEPPKTWSEFSETCQAVTKTDANGDYTSVGFIPDYPWVTVPLIPYAFGASLYDFETDTVTADSPKMIEAMEFKKSMYSGFYDTQKILKFKSGFGQYQSTEHPFFTGDVAFSFEGEWFPTFISEYAPDMNWGVAPLPLPDENPEQANAFLQSGMLVIPKASKHKEEAYTFIEWLTSDACQVELCAVKGNLPSTYSGLSNDSLFERAPSLIPFAEMTKLENVEALPALPFMGEYQNAMVVIEESVLTGEMSPQDALEKVVTEIQPLADEWAANR